MKKKHDELIAGTEWPTIPEGIYEAQCIKHEYGCSFGRKVLFLHWQIVTQGEQFGSVLFQALNVNYKRFSMGTSYYKTWCIANKARPKRGDRMSPKVFKKKVFSVRAVLVHKDDDLFRYSKIAEVKDCLT